MILGTPKGLKVNSVIKGYRASAFLIQFAMGDSVQGTTLGNV